MEIEKSGIQKGRARERPKGFDLERLWDNRREERTEAN
jgi:hypothetical protein